MKLVLGQDQSQKEEVREFWARTEEELGERVERYTMAHCVKGCLEGQGLWGLLFVTEQALYFHHFAKRNWFTSIVVADRDTASKEMRMVVPRDSIQSVAIHRQKSLLKRIFAYSPPVLEVQYRDAGLVDKSLHFTVDSRVEEFRKLLDPAGGE